MPDRRGGPRQSSQVRRAKHHHRAAIPWPVDLLENAVEQLEAAKRAVAAGNYAGARRLLRTLADNGDAGAQFMLGELYRLGQGVARNEDEALRWYRKAARQADAAAQGALGAMYLGGHGVAQNNATALKWFRLAADQGLAEAQFNLSTMYGNGQGVTQDDVQAHMWSNIAGGQGHRAARKARDVLAKHMTLAQIAQAQLLARNWQAGRRDEPHMPDES